MAPSPHQRRPSSRVWLCPWQGAGTPNGGADGRGTGWWHHSRGSDMAGPPDWQSRTSTCTAVLFKTVNDTAEFKSRRRNVQSSRTKGGGFAHGLLGQTCLSAAWILSSGLQPAGESWVRVPPLSTAFSVSRWRGAPPPPTPCPSWALGARHTWHMQTSARGGRRSRGAARASELVGPPPHRGAAGGCRTPAPSPARGGEYWLRVSILVQAGWTFLPPTTRQGTDADETPGLAGLPRPRVKLRHSTGTAQATGVPMRCLHQTKLHHFICISTCAELDVHFSESFPEWSCECQKKHFLPQYKIGKVHT